MADAHKLGREYEGIVKSIMAFRIPNGLPKVNILLFGGVGAGKSSLISTVDSLFKGRMSRRAPHGQGSRSFTRTLTKYSFSISLGSAKTQDAPFSLWDCAGWSDHDYTSGELGLILDGHLPSGFDLTQDLSPHDPNFITAPGEADKVHCVCFVVPCEAASDEDYHRRLKELKKYSIERGMPTLVFLTKVDQCHSELATEVPRLINASERLRSLIREVASLSGSGGAKDVFPMRSFVDEYEPDKAVGVPIIRALQHALYAAEDYLEGNPSHSLHQQPSPAPKLGSYQAVTDWQALSLKQGNLYEVHEVIQDGWARGTDTTTGATGYFPLAFVEPYEEPPAASIPVPTTPKSSGKFSSGSNLKAAATSVPKKHEHSSEPETHTRPLTVRIHIAGKVMARKVDHARSIWKELRSLLETENIILEEAEMEESQCIVGAYRVKGRLVCEDALKVFGPPSELGSTSRVLVLVMNTHGLSGAERAMETAVGKADADEHEAMVASLDLVQTVYIDEEMWLEDERNTEAMAEIVKLLRSLAQ